MDPTFGKHRADDHPANGEAVDETPIVALATPFARSALAVIRISGAGSVERFAGCFSDPARIRSADGNTVHHGHLVQSAAGGHAAVPDVPGRGSGDDAVGSRLVDEVMVAVYRAPRSYTGQESLEVFVHGGPPGIQRCLDLFLAAGFRAAEPGEFTLRAFLNGKLDLTRAEAVHELVSAQTARAHELALARLGGSVERRIDEVKAALVRILASVEVQLDYPDDEIEGTVVPRDEIASAMERLDTLGATYSTGRLYQEGARVALAGRTNAGKSSLFNLFLREDRSIVSDVHGTTRDYIESQIVIDGIPIRLFDTAGLRVVHESIETEGIRRSGMVIDNSDVVLYLVDAAEGVGDEDRSYIEKYGSHRGFIPVWNKIDLASGPTPEPFIGLSTKTGDGFSVLQERIVNAVRTQADPVGEEPVIDSLRQKRLIDRCVASLTLVTEGLDALMPLDVIALDLQDAVAALGEITGEVTSEDVLDAMFSGFCVGK